MKTTVVPAQVTTVEDKIAGNLGFTQLLLLVTPVFLGAAIFTILPPLFRVTMLKTTIVAILAFVCIVLSIRIKGKIILQWLAVVIRYLARPRFYLFNKNDSYLRAVDFAEPELQVTAKDEIEAEEIATTLLIPTPEKARIESAIHDPRSKFHLRAEKGGLRVYISEIKEEAI